MEIRSSAHRLMLLLTIGIFLLASLNGGVAHAQTPEPPVDDGQGLPYNEAEAHAIDQMLMCPVCPAETIDQAQVPLARQMRQIVREKLAQGATRQEILDFFAQRYGQDVLASPPKSGFNLVAWIFPPVGVAAALAAAVLVLRSMSARKSGSPAADFQSGPSEDLGPYLDVVDRELSLRESSYSDQASDTSELTPGDVRPSGEESRNNHG